MPLFYTCDFDLSSVVPEKIKIDYAIKMVLRYNIPDFDKKMIAKNRKSENVEARYMYFYFMDYFTDKSLYEILECTNITNHVTVIHGIKTIRNLIETDKSLAIKVSKCKEAIRMYI